MTKREQILNAVKTVLKAAGGAIDADKVFRSRVDPFKEGILPCITIEPVNDQANSQNMAFIDWTLTVRISIYSRSTDKDVGADEIADPIVEAVHNKLMADETLGGLLMGMAPKSLNWDFMEGNGATVGIFYDFELAYRTHF
jgi:hypothetical protein